MMAQMGGVLTPSHAGSGGERDTRSSSNPNVWITQGSTAQAAGLRVPGRGRTCWQHAVVIGD